MDINKKIEEIRQKPEHIRIRYVWGGVAILMFFIVFIWIFSIREASKKISPPDNTNLPDINQSLQDINAIKNDVPSIDEINKTSQNAIGQEAQNTTNIESQDQETVKGDSISNLPKENSANAKPKNPLLPIE